MAKNKNGFDNLSAKRFKDVQHSARMSENEVYSIMQRDFRVVVSHINEYEESQIQMRRKRYGLKHRNITPAKYPQYTKNMFANLSVCKYLYEIAKLWEKDKVELQKPDIEAIMLMIGTCYRDMTGPNNQYNVSDNQDRGYFICEITRIFNKKLYKKIYKFTSNRRITKGKLNDPDRKMTDADKEKAKIKACEIIMNTYGDPTYGAKAVISEFEKHDFVGDNNLKKKIKLLKKLYKNRSVRGEDAFNEFVGVALTNPDSGSDLVQYFVTKYVLKKVKNKTREYILRVYAEAYKILGSSAVYINENFVSDKRVKKIKKKLINDDIGYKKAFNVTPLNVALKKHKVVSPKTDDSKKKDKDEINKRINSVKELTKE